MALRNDYSDVQQIVTTSLSDIRITGLLETASVWVDVHLAPLPSFGEETLRQIERYLAAHLAVLAGESGGGQMVSAARADISEKYAEDESRTKTGATSYIRTAAALDPTGRVKAHWMGGKLVHWRVGDGYDFTGSGG